MLPWLWHRAAAAAPIPSLAQELPYATGAAIKKKKKGLLQHLFRGVVVLLSPCVSTFFFFFKVLLIYNVIISAVQQSDSVKHIHASILISIF